MGSVVVRVVAEQGATLPFKATEHAAGADLCAFLPKGPLTIQSGAYAMIPTGLVIELPVGFEGQVRPRSGLAARFGVTVLNSPGTIDSDYRGEVKVLLANFGNEPFVVHHGERIAQLVVQTVRATEFVKVCEVTITERGGGGFGSTGV